MPAVAASLEAAIEHHEAGRLDQAETLYREIIRIDPQHSDALHLLGVAAHQRADHRSGAELIRRAIERDAGSALYHCNLGACYRAMNRLDEAIDAFRAAIAIDAGFAGAHYNLASALAAAGRSQEAIDSYRNALDIDPHFLQAWNNLGSLLKLAGRADEACDCFRRIIAVAPSAEMHYNLANAHALAGRHDAAVAELERAIALDGSLPELQNNLGASLRELGRNEDALAAFERALALRPSYAEAIANLDALRRSSEKSTNAIDDKSAEACFARGYGLLMQDRHEAASEAYERGLILDDTNAAAWNNLGSCYVALEKWDEAIASYESALQIDAAYAKAHYNLGNVYKDLGDLPLAIAGYRRALFVEPALAEAHVNLGVVLERQGRLEESLASHDRAIALRPDNAEARFHRALTLLLSGDFARGWDAYEWRWKVDASPRDFAIPEWNGGDLSQQAILLHGEQGVGDEIMFASCVQEVIDRADRCLIECDPRLVPLLARSFPLADVVPRPLSAARARELGIDVQMPFGGLPRILRRQASAFPYRLRYLVADRDRRQTWRQRFAALGSGLKVGISWRGGAKPAIKRRRSTLLEQWLPILSVRGVQFVNLQYGDTESNRHAVRAAAGVTIHDWPDSDPLRDLDDFAAKVSELDLVISVDNATVHTAGALGVPCWTLLNFAPNWRWLRDCEDTLWYRSLSLLRQPRDGDWDGLLELAARKLRGHAATTTSKADRAIVAASPADPPAALDPQAAEERAKYRKIWEFDAYRRYSPGAAALDRIPLVEQFRQLGVRTILDAGCGSGKMMWRLMHEYPSEFEVHGFDISDNCLDPCFAEIKDRVLSVGCLWNPADFTRVYDAVICTDVMEHIPTERVPAVLSNLRKSARKFAYLSIAVVPDSFGPALIDEHLHLTVKKPNWWFAQLALTGIKVASHAVAAGGDGTDAQLHVFAIV